MVEKKEFCGKVIVYITLALWYSTEVLFNSKITKVLIWDIEDLNTIISYVVLILLSITIVFLQEYTRLQMLLIGSFSALIVIVTVQSNQKIMMATWLFVLAFKNNDFDKAIKITYLSQVIPLLVIFYMYSIGSIGEVVLYRNGLARHSFGFLHPNQLGIRIFSIVISRCYIRRNRRNIIDYLFVILAALFIDRVSNSRTTLYVLIILCVFMGIADMIETFNINRYRYVQILKMLAYTAVFMSLLLSIFDCRVYYATRFIDKYMGYRFSACYRTYMRYGVKLLGQDIQLFVSKPSLGIFYKYYLDNSYIAILLRYGPIMFIIFMSVYFATMNYFSNTKDLFLLEIFVLFVIYGVNENNLYLLSQNTFLLLLSVPIYNREKYKAVIKYNKRVRFVFGKV